jgi:hypothetical protein
MERDIDPASPVNRGRIMVSDVRQTQMILKNIALDGDCRQVAQGAFGCKECGQRFFAPTLRATKNPHRCGFRAFSRGGGYGWTRTTDPSIMSAVL